MADWYLYLIYISASIAIFGFCLNACNIFCMPMIRLSTKQQDTRITNQHCRNIVVVEHQAEYNNNSAPDRTISYITLEIPPPKYEDAIKMPPDGSMIRM